MLDDMRQNAGDDRIERLSEELKTQVQQAKARISERYAQMTEDRSFDPVEKREA